MEKEISRRLQSLQDLLNDKLTLAEIKQHIENIIITAKQNENDKYSYNWGFDDPRKMPADSRVLFYYIPSYYNVMFMIKAYLEHSKELKMIPNFMEVFSGGLTASMGRGFKGAGYESMEYFRRTIKEFLACDTDLFVERYPSISPAFTKQFSAATSFIADMADFFPNNEADDIREYIKLAEYRKREATIGKWKICWVNSEIDKGIRHIIVMLNNKGYITNSCCEGHVSRSSFNSKLYVYIGFREKYKWEIDPPFFGNEKGIQCRFFHNCIEWSTRRRIKSESKEADRQKILIEIETWVNSLPENK